VAITRSAAKAVEAMRVARRGGVVFSNFDFSIFSSIRPKHANPAIKVLWSSGLSMLAVKNRKQGHSMQCVPGF
jgi:hypothetical protein